ncbi:uncharacterized protein LOC131157815 [Malania oleifera]|uniref:uncharacterized protein LOC131157815 n=1 Tax=Malania oleifera TaxID=397392 RepID=UPI0025AE22C7|nr:uncharacterized protein LOC131157815 [Malania oleifera]
MAFFPTGSCSDDQLGSFCIIPVRCATVAPKSSEYVGMSGTEIAALKEALRAQQQLLHKLYFELDEEREASATATSEALSMILRLQEEKAAVKMEADQYKRMAEEKMFYAEECLAAFEDLMYQKELETASLEFQIQAYRYKLLSMGCSDLVAGEKMFSENLLLQRNDALVGDDFRRNNSLPMAQLQDLHCNSIERESSAAPVGDSLSMTVEENLGREFNAQGFDVGMKLENFAVGPSNSYWEQIKKLDGTVKDILERKDSKNGDKSVNFKGGLWSGSLHSQVPDQVKHPRNYLESQAFGNATCSLSVIDFLEVAQVHQNHRQMQKKEQSELGAEDQESKFYKPSDGVAVDFRFALVRPAIGVAEFQPDFLQLGKRMKQFEDDRKATRPGARHGWEEGKLLKEKHELPLLSVMEAMLHFWL